MKKQKEENFLLRTPLRKEGLKFEVDEKGIVTLLIENKGFFNRLFQKILKKPKVTHIHLDEMGSFIWPLLDGEDKIISALKIIDFSTSRLRQILPGLKYEAPPPQDKTDPLFGW